MNIAALRGLFAATVIGATAYVFVTSGQLPDPVASKFATGGHAIAHMSRAAHQWLMTALTLAIPLILYAAQALLPRRFARLTSIPRRDYWLATPERAENTFNWLERHALIWGIAPPLFFAGMQWMIVGANARVPAQLDNFWFLLATGAFVICVISAAVTLSLHFRRTA